jgi:hypothetical protein
MIVLGRRRTRLGPRNFDEREAPITALADEVGLESGYG